MAIMLFIAIFLASKLFILGVLLALWSFVLMIVWPLFRATKYLLTSPEIEHNQKRAWAGVAVAGVVSAILLTALPLRLHSNAEGVIWVPEQAHVYAQTDGFITAITTQPGTDVQSGNVLLTLQNSELTKRHGVLVARQTELLARQQSQRFKDPAAADKTADQLQQIQLDLDSVELELDGLTVTSNTSGRFVVDEKQSLQGSYVKKGQAIGYIVNPDNLIVRTVIPQTQIGLLRRNINDIKIRLAEHPNTVITAVIENQTPSASTRLPSRSLGAAGGGNIPVTADDTLGITAVDPVFLYDLQLQDNIAVAGIGSKAFIRINHGRESLASRWTRSARQLFLSRLSI